MSDPFPQPGIWQPLPGRACVSVKMDHRPRGQQIQSQGFIPKTPQLSAPQATEPVSGDQSGPQCELQLGGPQQRGRDDRGMCGDGRPRVHPSFSWEAQGQKSTAHVACLSLQLLHRALSTSVLTQGSGRIRPLPPHPYSSYQNFVSTVSGAFAMSLRSQALP